MNYALKRVLFSNFSEFTLVFIIKLIFIFLNSVIIKKVEFLKHASLVIEIIFIAGCLTGFNYLSQNFYNYGINDDSYLDTNSSKFQDRIEGKSDVSQTTKVMFEIYEFVIIPLLQAFCLVVISPHFINYFNKNLNPDLIDPKKYPIRINILVPMILLLCINFLKVQVFQHPTYVDLDNKLGEKDLIFPPAQLLSFIIFMIVYYFVNKRTMKFYSQINIPTKNISLKQALINTKKYNHKLNHPYKNDINKQLNDAIAIMESNDLDKFEKIWNITYKLENKLSFFGNHKFVLIREINKYIRDNNISGQQLADLENLTIKIKNSKLPSSALEVKTPPFVSEEETKAINDNIEKKKINFREDFKIEIIDTNKSLIDSIKELFTGDLETFMDPFRAYIKDQKLEDKKLTGNLNKILKIAMTSEPSKKLNKLLENYMV